MRKGLATAEDVRAFLTPRLTGLSDPFLLPNMRIAVDRILQAIDRRERIVLFGDYDVDGVTSLALLDEMLHAYGVVVRHIVLYPLIMPACAGALAAALHLHLPVAIDNTLLFLQNAAAPVALFVLGVTVALRPFSRMPWEVPGVIAVKLLIHPLVVFGSMLLFGPFAQPWAATAVLMASLPPALNVFVIARQNDTWIEPASVAVLIGTFASVITLTSVMWFIQSGRLVFP